MEKYISAFLYIFIFIIVLLLFKLAENEFAYCDLSIKKKRRIDKITFSKRKLHGYIFAFTSIVILSIFAGLRGPTVGTDTGGYVVTYMRIANQCSSFFEFLDKCPDLSNEQFGGLLVYLCSRITNKTNLLLFSYQFLTITPVFLASIKMKDQISITDSIAIYLFIFFNNSLNMMRQSVGCAFILLGLSNLIKERKVTFDAFLSFIFAILFHKYSIFGVVMVLAVWYSFLISKKVLKIIIYVLIIVMPIFMNFASGIIVTITDNASIIYYVNIFINKTIKKDWFISPLSPAGIVSIAFYGGMLVLLYLYSTEYFTQKIKTKSNIYRNEIILRLITMNTVGFLIYISVLFSLKTFYGYRFSAFFDYLYILSIPLTIKKKTDRKQIMYFFLLSAWFMLYIRMSWGETQVYVLGI